MKLFTIRRVTGAAVFAVMLCGLSLKAQTIKDIDGNVYKTVKHGTQVWCASNLNVSHFRNGEPIPEAKTPEEWKNAGTGRKPAWCYYNNDPENGKKYGKLYNWYAIKDPRGLVPKGWHVPLNADWIKLVKNLTGTDIAGKKLKSATAWKSGQGTDLIHFGALPAGYCDAEGKFVSLGTICKWWTNSVPTEVQKSNLIFSVEIKDNSPELRYLQVNKESGLSIRIVKN